MAFIRADIKSPGLGRTIPTWLYFPTDLPEAVGNRVKGVITLLHGFSNISSDWMMMSAAPRYAADNGYILIVPTADNSFYNDMHHGTSFYHLLTKELPRQLGRIFRIPTEREKNFIAGLSMGGYGALRIGLSYPQRYAAIGSFSGALDMGAMLREARVNPAVGALFTGIFGDALQLPEEADLFGLAKQTAALPAERQPAILVTCGEQDDDDDSQILTQNNNFNAVAKNLPLARYEYRTWPGVHEWNFWDRSLAEFIGFAQNSSYGLRKRADWGA